MHAFLKTFLLFYTFYGILHIYAFLKIYSVFKLQVFTALVTGVFLIVMMFTQSLMRICSLRSTEKVSRLIAHIGSGWMSIIFFFFLTGLPLDIYNFSIKYIGITNRFAIPSPYTIYIPLILTIPLSIYSYIEAGDIRVKRLKLSTSKLPHGTEKLTIVHITDLHLGVINKERMLDRVISEIQKANPDIVVSSGDLIEEETNHIMHLTEKLRSIKPRLGKYAVTGNHEFFVDINSSLRFMHDSGFKVLRSEGITAGGILNIAGVDDPDAYAGKIQTKSLSERQILDRLPSQYFTILLKHRPEVEKESIGLFDLQLSGHTHGGQFFPVNMLIRLLFPHHAGFRKITNGSAIYVSRGAGTSCSVMRFLSPPELTIITLVSKESAQMGKKHVA
jgi:hypothetical protein